MISSCNTLVREIVPVHKSLFFRKQAGSPRGLGRARTDRENESKRNPGEIIKSFGESFQGKCHEIFAMYLKGIPRGWQI